MAVDQKPGYQDTFVDLAGVRVLLHGGLVVERPIPIGAPRTEHQESAEDPKTPAPPS